MSVANAFQTYGDSTIETDIVRNSVEILSASVNDIYSKLGKTAAISTVHSYSVDTLLAAGSQAVQQGADFSYSARTAPTLLTNIVQETAVALRVTRPAVAVSRYSGENELARQTSKALTEFVNSVEFDLVRSTLVSGVSGTVAKMSKLSQLFFDVIYSMICPLQGNVLSVKMA